MPNDAFDRLEKPRYMDVFPAGCSKDLENKHVEYDGLRDYLIDMLSKIGGQKAANGVMDGDILNLAILCQMLWNAPDVLDAHVMIADEQLDCVEGYKEYIHHEPQPQPEPEEV